MFPSSPYDAVNYRFIKQLPDNNTFAKSELERMRLLSYRWGNEAHNGGTTKAMIAILPFLLCLQPELIMTTIRQFSLIALAMLAMTGRVTMLGISRWAGSGGSYRTVQRFFATTLPWATLFWLFFRTQLFQKDDVYLLGGD